MFQMTGAPSGSFFKLKCKLRSGVGGVFDFGEDDLFTYSNIYYFPDATSAASESRTFDVSLGEGVLDEDIGTDEVYAQFMLVNMSTGNGVNKNSNTVSHEFNP